MYKKLSTKVMYQGDISVRFLWVNIRDFKHLTRVSIVYPTHDCPTSETLLRNLPSIAVSFAL